MLLINNSLSRQLPSLQGGLVLLYIIRMFINQSSTFFGGQAFYNIFSPFISAWSLR
jgi:hypothetical protein